MIMEAASTPETSANFYYNTQRNNPDDSHLHTRRCENIKSHNVCKFSIFSIRLKFSKMCFGSSGAVLPSIFVCQTLLLKRNIVGNPNRA
jgi:hypothetical protein